MLKMSIINNVSSGPDANIFKRMSSPIAEIPPWSLQVQNQRVCEETPGIIFFTLKKDS